MSETTMPAIEADIVAEGLNQLNAYELAFHILPTVAEGEVQSVFDSIKALITKDGGTITDEEAPERFELAYEIVKSQEGKNRKFRTAYFGWIRFTAEATTAAPLLEEMDTHASVLRHILIKLSKTEAENPFRFHESIESFKMVTTIDEDELVAEDVLVEDIDGTVVDEVAVEEEKVVA
jgi:small subunit ribosomal protein S6